MASIVDALRKRDARVDAIAGAGAIASCVLIWPDWLDLRSEKIINHSFLVGTARLESGDEAGALAAFEAGAAWNPADADCPLRIARIFLARGDVAGARRQFEKSLANFPPGHDAVLGLGECALAAGKPQETLKLVARALQIAPNNMDALSLGSRAFAAMGDWARMAAVCGQMRSYPTHPATVDFSEAWALALAGRGGEALPLYDSAAATPWFSRFDRARAAFFGGIVAWHHARDHAEAVRRWRSIAGGPPTLFQPLAQLLTGDAAGENAIAAFPKDMHWRSRQYVDCALGMKASLDGKPDEARRRFEAVVAMRDARNLPAGQREIIEVWAIEELDRPSPDERKLPAK
jgi:tetratricopeptide (TPR) repeat protein